MKKIPVRRVVRCAAVAAVYTIATVLIAPLSYQAVQFRLSELLMFLAFCNPANIPGLVLGCFLANLFGPFGLPDAIGGSVATLAAALGMAWAGRSGRRDRGAVSSLLIASLFPILACLILAFEIVTFTGATGTYWYWVGMTALGEGVVVTVCGVPLMRSLYRRCPKLLRFLKS